MGTHAVIQFSDVQPVFIHNEDGTIARHPFTGQPEIADYEPVSSGLEIYMHYDGYPEGWGAEIAEILVRGTSHSLRKPGGPTREMGEGFFGLGCFIATLIATIKPQTGPGNCYVYSEGAMGQQEYHYEIIYDGSCQTQVVPYLMRCLRNGDLIFSGDPIDFLRRWAPKTMATIEEEFDNAHHPPAGVG